MRTFGLELFGTLALTRAIAYYFTIFTQYGFPYSATREIALKRSDAKAYSEVFCCVQLLKIGILILAAGFLGGLTLFSSTCAHIASTLWLYFIVISAATLFPTWFFQGMERMGLMTVLNLSQKALFFAWMFLFVRGPEDFGTYIKVLASLELVRLGLAHLICWRFWRPYLKWPSKNALLIQMRAGWHIFLSNLSINSYSRLPTVFLGIYAGPASAGIYYLGMRITRSLLGLIEPLVQAYFPIASRNIGENQALGIQAGLRFLFVSALIMGVIGCILFLGAGPIGEALAGEQLSAVTAIMQLFAFLPLIAIISNILGVGMLVNMGYASDYSKVMITAGITCAGALFFCVPPLGAIGASLGVLICESFATAAMATTFMLRRSATGAAQNQTTALLH